MTDKQGIVLGLAVIALVCGMAAWLVPQDQAAAAVIVDCRAAGGIPIIAADRRFECLKGVKS